MTAQRVIELALQLIGVLAQGETAQTQDLNDGLDFLNTLVSAWSNDDLIIPSIIDETFTLPAKQEVTIGASQDIVTTNPLSVYGDIFITDSGTRYEVFPAAEEIIRNYYPVNVKPPHLFYFVPGLTTSAIVFNSIPTAGSTAIIKFIKPITKFMTLSSTSAFPEGYELLLYSNLAVILSPKYGKPSNQTITSMASVTWDKIKAHNDKQRPLRPLQMDSGMPGVRRRYR